VIKVEISFTDQAFRKGRAELIRLVRGVCRYLGARAIYVDLAVLQDAQIRTLNRQLTGRRASTDCLSLDLSDPNDPIRVIQIMVNGQMATRQARIRGIKPISELALYVVHGLLHQFGHDDGLAAKARQMHQLEDKILQRFGFGRAYYTGPDECKC